MTRALNSRNASLAEQVQQLHTHLAEAQAETVHALDENALLCETIATAKLSADSAALQSKASPRGSFLGIYSHLTRMVFSNAH